MYFRCEFSESYDLMDYRGGISETARLSVFWVRILRFSQAKILGFFLWLSAKKLKRQFVPRACSAHHIFLIKVNAYLFPWP